MVNRLDVFGVENLPQAVDLINGTADMKPFVIDTRELSLNSLAVSTSIFGGQGQEAVKRAFLRWPAQEATTSPLVGAPGSSKSMMAKRLPSILPPLTMQEALETTKIHSVAGKLTRGSMLMTQGRSVRPTILFRL